VGALSSEDLLTLSRAWGSLKVIARDCAAGNAGHERVRLAVEKARVFARAMGAAVTMEWRDETSPPKVSQAKPRRPVAARRQLLGLLVAKAPGRKLTTPARLDVAAIRAVSTTPRRQRFLATLPPSFRPAAASLPGESVSCLSTKQIERSRCTACMLCVTACPTGALQTARLHQEIRFEARKCVNCHLCHDVCEPKAITADPELNLIDFLDSKPKVLVSFQMTLCGECGAPFNAERDDQVMCSACRERHSEARTLWGHR
jgi:ferredoxin